MPFDALFLTAVRRELESSLTGCRVDKVQQPQRDTLILSMRGAAGGGKLLLTASPNHPRIHLTNEPAENPAQPPMFCMLLRKHLTGGRLVGMQQPEMERLLDLTFDCTDEMGSPTQKHLILEIMGRNSNLILTAEDGRILDCLRRVDFEMSEQRQVLPGLYYHLPSTQGKRDPFAVTQEELTALLLDGAPRARGVFLSMEGMDGCGKTTQRNALVAHLEQLGWAVQLTREPGGDAIAEKIRELVLDPANQEMFDETEAYLYAAARAQNVRALIRPALAAGKAVVCDRFVDSSIAYQGGGRQLGSAGIAARALTVAMSTTLPSMKPPLISNLPLSFLAKSAITRAGATGSAAMARDVVPFS